MTLPRGATIGLHPLWMDTDPHGGIASDWSSLIAGLGEVDDHNRYRVYYTAEGARRSIAYRPSHFEARVLRPASRWAVLPFALPLELAGRPVDLLHVQSIAPPFTRVPFVASIQDLAWVLHPDVFPPLLRLRLDLGCRSTARRAQRVVTMSHFSKRQIAEHYGVPEHRIEVIYLSTHPVYRVVNDHDAVQAARRRHDLGDHRFILYVGKIQARKNLVRLVHAFAACRREYGLPHKLVLVGKRTYLSDDIFAAIDELGLRGDVRVLGEVPLEDMPLLHAASDLFVFPSLSEGFGLPPLEAMACGSPVVASNATSLPEVLGDAALLVDPHDVAGLARTIRDVATSPQLRADLRERGLRRAAQFSGRARAERMVEVYEDVLRARRSDRSATSRARQAAG